MHGILPFLLAMIAAIVMLETLASKLRVAYPIVLVVAGLLISFIPGLPAIRVNPELIFFIVLPPLLADAAWNISFKEMKKWWRIISSFAFLVVLFTALAVASFYGIDAKEHDVTLTDPQIKVRVLEIGDGEPLVIVPGNTGDAFVLASLMTELKGRRIYAINRPGGGLSEGMDHTTVNIREFAHQSLNTILEVLDLKNADVVAHSMGAHWATLLAMERPDKVRRLALLGNPGNIMGGKPPLVIRIIGRPPFTKWAMHFIIPKNKEKALKTLTMMGHSKKFVATLPEELADAYFNFQHLPHYTVSAASLIQNMIPEIKAEELANLQKPTVLILGTNDNFLSQEKGKKIAEVMPKGSFYSMANSGHLPWLENPEEIGRMILDFFRN